MTVTFATLGHDGPLQKGAKATSAWCAHTAAKCMPRSTPTNNLAHCFQSKKNLNNIDLLLTLGDDFAAAVAILERWLERHQTLLPKTPTTQDGK